MPKRKRAPNGLLTSPSKKQVTERPVQVDFDEAISHMDAAMLADHLAKTLKRHAASRSAIELEDQFLPASAICDTTAFAEPRVSKHLPQFLHSLTKDPDELATCHGPGSPHTIIVTASGIRAADLTRELRLLASDDYKIAKLFAKHMKLQPTIDFLQKTKVIIGVGTPTRLKELVDHGAIAATALKRIVVDGSYVDDKKRTIFDMPEIFLPMLDLLNAAIARSPGLDIVIF